jgi:endonuclease/exonuclease/phosphatase (EEP) superfamily protein YafD
VTTSALAGPDLDPDAGPPPVARRIWGTLLCWTLVALWTAVALGRLAGFDGGVWPLVLLPALTPYVALSALIPLAVSLLARRRLAAVIALVVQIVLVGVVAPRTFGSPDPVRGPAVRVLTANLAEGQADPAAIVALVREHRVDVLAVSELTGHELAALTDAGITKLLPYVVANPGRTTTGGTGLFSRYPVTDGRRIPLVDGFIETSGTVSVPGAQPVDLTVVHYCAPADPGQLGCWDYGKSHIPPATPDGPVRLLLGDFNLTVDYAALRAVLATGYRDAASVVGEGLTTTWPYDGTPAPRVAIDHVLADHRIGVSSVSAHGIRDSDHRAVFAELTFPKV